MCAGDETKFKNEHSVDVNEGLMWSHFPEMYIVTDQRWYNS